MPILTRYRVQTIRYFGRFFFEKRNLTHSPANTMYPDWFVRIYVECTWRYVYTFLYSSTYRLFIRHGRVRKSICIWKREHFFHLFKTYSYRWLIRTENIFPTRNPLYLWKLPMKVMHSIFQYWNIFFELRSPTTLVRLFPHKTLIYTHNRVILRYRTRSRYLNLKYMYLGTNEYEFQFRPKNTL